MTSDPATASDDSVVDGEVSGYRVREGFEPVIAVADLPDNTLMGMHLTDGTPICIFRVDGGVHAVHDCCTHQAFPMSAGELLPDGSLECAWHGALFDPVTGQPRRGPACEALRVYRVLVEDGMVHVARSP